MSVSKLLASGGANDFNLNITGPTTIAQFDKEYASGSYSIVSSGNDTTTDIYAYNAAGTLVGFTSTKAFTASGGFNKMVVLGGTVGDVLGFTYKKTITTTTATAEVTAGPAIYSCTPTILESANDTTTITGANFASNVTVHFSGTGYASTPAKSVVRTNSTTLVVTRPDTFPASVGAYTITVSNPGVSNPVGSNAHILANAVTAGAGPTWVTTSPITFTLNTAWDGIALSATDDSGTTPTYSVVSGTLPTGLSMSSAGVFTGTPTTSNMTVTIRATDNNGDTTDRAFRFNARPVWSTAAGSLTGATKDSAYSFQLSATDDISVSSYSVVSGTLPTGLTMTSGGLISGTPTVYTPSPASFTVRATDGDGGSSDRAFSIAVLQVGYTTFTASGTYVSASNQTVDYLILAGGGSGGGRSGDWPGCGGGGAGGLLAGTVAVTAGTNYAIVVGARGNGGNGSISNNGGNSSAFGLTANGGGGGGSPQLNNYRGRDGGSGGGSTYNQSGGSGTGGQGNNGGDGNQGNPASGGGGGGRGSAGSTWSNPVGGSGYTWINGTTYAGGGGGGPADNNSGSQWAGGSGGGGTTRTDASNYGSGGGACGAPNTYTGAGSQGIVIIRGLG